MGDGTVKYTPDLRPEVSGMGRMMKNHPGLHLRMREIARERLAVMRSRAPVSRPGAGGRKPGTLRSSGRVEYLGIRPVKKGGRRMTYAIVFDVPYAAIMNAKTGFMQAGLKQWKHMPDDFSEG